MEEQTSLNRTGLGLGLGCYLIWGVFPIYIKMLNGVPPMEVVTYRILFTLALLSVVTFFRGRFTNILAIFRSAYLTRQLATSAALVAGNWVIYIWAVASNHLLAASLGYFLNPLVNVGLGVLVLGERLSLTQKIAVAIAALGVVIAASTALGDLWVSVSLAVSFGFYGLIRKSTPVEAVDGLMVETIVLAPMCVGLLWWWSRTSTLSFGHDMHLDLLLMFSAVATSVPLTMFARAAQLLPYATVGLLQYVAPSIVFALATFGYHERLNPVMLVAFGFISVALIVFSLDLIRNLANANKVAVRAA